MKLYTVHVHVAHGITLDCMLLQPDYIIYSFTYMYRRVYKLHINYVIHEW